MRFDWRYVDYSPPYLIPSILTLLVLLTLTLYVLVEHLLARRKARRLGRLPPPGHPLLLKVIVGTSLAVIIFVSGWAIGMRECVSLIGAKEPSADGLLELSNRYWRIACYLEFCVLVLAMATALGLVT